MLEKEEEKEYEEEQRVDTADVDKISAQQFPQQAEVKQEQCDDDKSHSMDGQRIREISSGGSPRSNEVSEFDRSVNDAYEALRALHGAMPAAATSAAAQLRLGPEAPAASKGVVMRRKRFLGIRMLSVKQEVLLSIENGVLIFSEEVHGYLCGVYNLLHSTVHDVTSTSSSGLVRIDFSQQHKGIDLGDVAGTNGSRCLELLIESASLRRRWTSAIGMHIQYAANLQQWKQQQQKQQLKLSTAASTGRGEQLLPLRVATVDSAGAAADDLLRDSLSVLPLQVRRSNLQEQHREPPKAERGWLLKKGHLYPSIKLRYFVLEQGRLQYFSEDVDDPQSCHRARLKGSLLISGYAMRCCTAGGAIKITISPGPQSLLCHRVLEMYCDNFMDQERWVAALQQHAQYYLLAPSNYG